MYIFPLDRERYWFSEAGGRQAKRFEEGEEGRENKGGRGEGKGIGDEVDG